jgi:hypothetical protein
MSFVFVARYLDCGNPHNGFARVKCKDCGYEYLLAFTFKRYCFQTVIIDFLKFVFLRSCR